MSKEKKTIRVLNTLLQGESMAVESVDLIEKAMKGETRGINKTEKILRGKLDDKSRDIVGEVLQQDRTSVKKLNN